MNCFCRLCDHNEYAHGHFHSANVGQWSLRIIFMLHEFVILSELFKVISRFSAPFHKKPRMASTDAWPWKTGKNGSIEEVISHSRSYAPRSAVGENALITQRTHGLESAASGEKCDFMVFWALSRSIRFRAVSTLGKLRFSAYPERKMVLETHEIVLFWPRKFAIRLKNPVEATAIWFPHVIHVVFFQRTPWTVRRLGQLTTKNVYYETWAPYRVEVLAQAIIP